MSNYQNIAYDIVKKILNILKTTSITNPIVNTFIYNNESINLDEKACNKIFKVITRISPEEKQNLIKKKQTTNKLEKAVEHAIHEAILDAQNNEKASLSNFNGKEIFFKLLKENHIKIISTITNQNIAYLLMEDVWTTFQDKNTNNIEFLKTSFVELSTCLGTSFIEWWSHNFLDKTMYKNKTYDEFCKIFRETYKIKTQSENIFKWLWNKEKKVEDLSKLTEEFSIKIGSYFIEYLTLHNIFKEHVNIEKNKPKTLSLTKKHEDSIITSNLFIKPILYPTMSQEFKSKIDHKSFFFKILKKQKHAKTPKFSYEKTSKLETMLNTNDVQYCINKPYFNLYLNYLHKIEQIPFTILLTSPNSEEALLISEYIYTTYHFDIYNLISNCNSDHLKLFLEFMGNSQKLFDTDLRKKFNFAKRQYSKKYSKIMEELTKNRMNKKSKGIYNLNQLIEYNLNKKGKKFKKLAVLIKKINASKLLSDCYYKVIAQKFYNVHFIKDAIIYQHFKYFYLPKEISGVGRIQTISHILSFQTNKFARPFIHYFIKNKITINLNLYNQIQTLFAKKISVQSELQNMSFDLFKEETKILQEEHLASFFNKDINLTQHKLDFDDLSKAISTIKSYIKKPVEILNSLSILYYREKDGLYTQSEPVIFLDSTMSGTQHLSTIFRNKLAAKNSCLISSGETKFDLNTDCLEKFQLYITKTLPIEAANYLAKFNIDRNKLHSLDIKQIFDLLCKKIFNSKIKYLSLSSFLKAMALKYEKKSCPISDTHFLPNLFIIECDCIISNKVLNKISKKNKTILFLKKLLIVIYDYVIQMINKKEPWILENIIDRIIIKQTTMADLYGMTIGGSRKSILNAFTEKIIEKGKFDIDLSYIRIFSDILSKYYKYSYKVNYLPYSDKYLKLRQSLRKMEGPLTMSTEFLTWSFFPRKMKTLRINVAKISRVQDHLESSKRRMINVGYFTEKIDQTKIYNAVSAFIIHTEEARLMMYYIYTSQQLNKALQETLGIPYYYTQNYDCFGINYSFIVFLKIQLKLNYKNCYDHRLLPSLFKILNITDPNYFQFVAILRDIIKSPNDEDYWDGSITSHYFVKF